MNGGIDQLVDTYKVNPNPLQERVQRAQQQMQQKMLQQGQQGQPSNEIPPDLEEAIALQQIAKLHQNAQNQQAMQAGGAQPSVVAKLHQMLGTMRQQAQPQGAPAPQGEVVAAARGGSIDQLMSNLGRHYAGGGIIAFTKGGDEGLSEEDKKAKQREDDRRALLEPLAALGDIAQLPIAAGYNLAADTGTGLEKFLNRVGSALTGQEVNTQSGDQVGSKFRFSPTPFTDMLRKPTDKEAAQKQAQATPAVDLATIREQLNKADAAQFAQKPTANVPVPTGNAPAAARPSAVPGAGGPTVAAATAAKLDPNGLRALSEKMIREEMGLNPETESDKMVARARKLMGMDEILNEKRARVSDFEKAVAESKASRTPEWVKALQAAGGAPVRGGIGMLLGQMGAAATKTREGYDSQDLEYKRELNRLRDVISDAQLKGNTELAKEALTAYREVDARRKAGLTSATSLLNTDQQTEASNQRAREALAARTQIANAQMEDKRLRRIQEQKNFLAQEERKWQDTLNKNPEYKKLIDQRSMQERLLYMSTDPKVQDKAQEAVEMLNEKIARLLPTAGGGTVNIPAPPKGAVTRVG